MLIIILIIATLLMMAWLVLLGRVSEDDWLLASYAAVYDKRFAISKLAAKDKANKERLASLGWADMENVSCGDNAPTSCGIISLLLVKLLLHRGVKKIAKLNKEIEELQRGILKSINIFIMPGYVLQREIEAIGKSSFRKVILSKCFELYGKKHAGYKTSQLLAKMLSYPIVGIAGTLVLGTILLGFGNTSVGMGIIGIGSSLILVLVYGIYDELSDLVKKRQNAIARQFPNVISKLALLVTSGMIMDRAWKETAHSQETELYMEMRRTSKELDNLVSPEAAYGNFISRCNTKETAKLASAIMQNQSKGNAEIGRLLKDMAREVWQERRHTAKRDAEKANSKLMIPTMLLFLAILVMLMVPIAMNFTGI